MVSFVPTTAGAAFLVYLYKQGTFYPFCPTGPPSRDTLKERQVRDAVGGDLPIEDGHLALDAALGDPARSDG